ncbi:MAG: hypothetical protein KAI91_03890 [Candidatus Omnitrophica bacterium]|nr:hypothetical protein [Candidatus Omnitrophota bacterium]MCK5393454.1 hypothetical protein [Candidatus Omnitrophota bacterium]
MINDNARKDHFLITSLDKTNKPEQLMRIDNSINSGISEINKLTKFWACPSENIFCNTYYYFIWQDYTQNKINLNLKSNFQFINFVAEFPDDFLTKLLLSKNINTITTISDIESKKFKKHDIFF